MNKRLSGFIPWRIQRIMRLGMLAMCQAFGVLLAGVVISGVANAVAAQTLRPLYQESFDDGPEAGPHGQAGVDLLVDAANRIDMERGTFAFFAKREKTRDDRPGPWFRKAQYPAGDRDGYRRIGGVAQRLGEGYYFQGMGFERWGDELVFLFLDAGRLSPPVRLGSISQDWPVDSWRHLAVVWDHNQGIKIYLDGKEAWSNWGQYQWQWSLYPNTIFLNGVADELHVYADCLTDQQIASLARGEEPQDQPVAFDLDEKSRLNELNRYGWQAQQREALPQLKSGQGIEYVFASITQMSEWHRPQSQPRDGLNNTTWPPIYYGPAIKGQRLEIQLADQSVWNHVVAFIQRSFQGELQLGNRSLPVQTEGGTLWRHTFDQDMTATQIALLRQKGQLGRLDFFHTQPLETPAAQAQGLTYFFASTSSYPDSELGRILATETSVQYQQPVAALTEVDARWTLRSPAFGGFQAFTPPPEDAQAYDGMAITLVAQNMKGPVPVRIRIKEPVHSQKDWLVADVLLVPTTPVEGEQRFIVRLKGRPVVNLPPMRVRYYKASKDEPYTLQPGVAFGLSLTAGEPVQWVMGEGGCSMTPLTTSKDRILAEASDDQVEFMRQGFATLMEGHLYEDPRIQVPMTWLAWFTPQRKEYRQMDRRGALRMPFEGYIRTESETHAEPANPYNAPLWALWQQEAMAAIRKMVYWRIDTMQLPTGEFGSTFNDDTIHIEGWINYAMAMDDSRKITRAIHRFHNGLFRYGLDQGVTRYVTDAGHASEEGSSSIAMGIMLNYGDPLTYERLLAASSHYDNWLKPAGKGYEAISNHVSGATTWPQPELANAYGGGIHQLMVPAGYLTWYNRHPVAWKYLDGVIQHDEKYGRMDDFFTGARNTMQGQETPDPGVNPKARNKPYRSASPFRPYRSRGADDTPLWQNWRNTNDARYLVDMYQRMTEWFDNYDWLITRAMPSLDRIAEPTIGLIASRLGEKVSDRGSAYLTWPEYAVSFTRSADDVAALVTSNRVDGLAMRFFPFTQKPHAVQLRLWRLHPGTYQLKIMSDQNDDGQGEEQLSQETIEVIRGQYIDFTLPPGQCSVLTLTPISIHEPDFTLPDPAISLDTIEVVYARHLVVKVHNLGSTAATDVMVRVRDARSGKVIPGGEQRIKRIEPALDFKPSYMAVQFDEIYSVTQGLIVEIESENPDLVPWNNRVELDDSNLLGPGYIGIEKRARQ